jgi:hypothetical protein
VSDSPEEDALPCGEGGAIPEEVVEEADTEVETVSGVLSSFRAILVVSGPGEGGAIPEEVVEEADTELETVSEVLFSFRVILVVSGKGKPPEEEEADTELETVTRSVKTVVFESNIGVPTNVLDS